MKTWTANFTLQQICFSPNPAITKTRDPIEFFSWGIQLVSKMAESLTKISNRPISWIGILRCVFLIRFSKIPLSVSHGCEHFPLFLDFIGHYARGMEFLDNILLASSEFYAALSLTVAFKVGGVTLRPLQHEVCRAIRAVWRCSSKLTVKLLFFFFILFCFVFVIFIVVVVFFSARLSVSSDFSVYGYVKLLQVLWYVCKNNKLMTYKTITIKWIILGRCILINTFDCTRMILTFGSFGEGKAFWAACYEHLIRETSDETW